jgi:hypothetical protein
MRGYHDIVRFTNYFFLYFFQGYVLDRRIGFIEEETKRPKYNAVDTDVENATP